MKYRNFLSLGIIVIICLGVLSSCGKEEIIEKDKKIKLAGEIKIYATEGTSYASVSKLPKDYKVIKGDGLEKVKEALIDGKCDLAVLPAMEASKLYNTNGGIKAITTLSLGKWEVVSKGNIVTNPFAFISGRKIYALEDVSQSSEAVLKAIMVKHNKNIYAGQIEFMDEKSFLNRAKVYGVTSIAKKSLTDELLAVEEDMTTVLSLDDVWQENFKTDIPEYVLVASDDFLSSRHEEIGVILEDLAKSLKEAQGETKDKLVSYDVSNRGLDLIKKFNDVMIEDNPDAIGGKKVSSEYYFYR